MSGPGPASWEPPRPLGPTGALYIGVHLKLEQRGDCTVIGLQEGLRRDGCGVEGYQLLVFLISGRRHHSPCEILLEGHGPGPYTQHFVWAMSLHVTS